MFVFQFNDMMGDLLGWLADAEHLLTSEYTVGNDPAKIKGQIAKHKVRENGKHWFLYLHKKAL